MHLFPAMKKLTKTNSTKKLQLKVIKLQVAVVTGAEGAVTRNTCGMC